MNFGMDQNTIYDFNNENKVVMVLGGFMVLKTTPLHYVFNTIFLTCQFGLYAYLFVMALYTMLITTDDKVTLIRAFHSLCLLLVAVVFLASKYITNKYVNEALEQIKDGIFKYLSEDSSESHKLLKMRVKQIRFGSSAFTKLLMSCAMVYIFLLPLVQRLTVTDRADALVNPYLPLPFYMPFDTRTFLGYSIAFISNAAFYVFFFLAVLCAVITYISCAVHLIAQLEVLNMSLMNIERRAVAKLKRKNVLIDEKITDLYKIPVFQNCLYACLRENILHHQAILRFTKAASPFLEAVNGAGLMFFSIIMASSIFLILEEPSINIAIFMILLAEMVCYYLVSLIGEIITEKSIETAITLYSTPWPHCDEKFKFLLKIMANYLKKPIILKSTGFSSVCSLETFGDMIAVGYKLVNILR